jgi:hypothetical protein
MLGRVRRTTRTDVTLALISAGIVYLAYALSCYVAKVSAMTLDGAVTQGRLAAAFRSTFGAGGADVFDMVGPLWMVASLWQVIRASRQRRIISWSWLLISGQALAAVLMASWAALSLYQTLPSPAMHGPVSWSPRLVVLAVVVWVGTLIWLVVDSRRMRRGPTMGDGVKTMLYRR